VKSFARIHRQNLINAGILPLEFVNEADYDQIEQGDILVIDDLKSVLSSGTVTIKNETKGTVIETKCELSERMKDVMRCGGLLDYTKANLK